MKIYAIQRTDGGVSIMRIIDDSISPESEISRWPDELRNRVSGIVEITEAQIPTDRTYREAWAVSGRGIVEDPVKRQALIDQRTRESTRSSYLDELAAKIESDPTILERIK